MSFRDSARLESAIASVLEDSSELDLSAATLARLAQLVTVWASGYLEATCREVVLDYTKKRADDSVVNYVSRTLDRFHNPRFEKILDLLRGLDEDSADLIMRFADGQIKVSVNSIVANRHRIAHGKSTQISMAQVLGYYGDAQRLARRMKEVF